MSDTFSDLPDALVRDLLSKAVPVAENVRGKIDLLKNQRNELRRIARDNSIIKRKADLDISREPSVAGIDGSYQIHRLTSFDLCASAGVAVEGTAKEATRHWPEPRHRFWVGNIKHNDKSTGVLRGIMVSMELDLAHEAPHDLVLLDGSFASLIIYLNQGLFNIDFAPDALGNELSRRWTEQQIFLRLLSLLSSDRIVAVPKYTSRNELLKQGKFPAIIDDIDGRTLATLILEPGEYSQPIKVYNDEQYHLPDSFCTDTEQERLNTLLDDIWAVYYRPFGWIPAIRIEVPGPIANSLTKLSLMLEGIERQFFSPAVHEPYPLFLADRMVKSLGSGIAVVEQTVAQHVVDKGIDAELAMLFLQNYRTEGGRGGV